MNLVILTMRDAKVSLYLQPFAVMTVPAGVRDIQEVINANDKQLPWQKFPTDFDLYRVGTFDTETGKLNAEEPSIVMNLGTLKGD